MLVKGRTASKEGGLLGKGGRVSKKRGLVITGEKVTGFDDNNSE